MANQPLETLETYISRAKQDKTLGKDSQPRRTFDNFKGILPENFKAIQSQISTFFQDQTKTNLQDIFKNFDKEFDNFADGKNYSPEETIKYKSAFFFKLISLHWVDSKDINVNLSNYVQKTSGEFFSTVKKEFMTLDQYYQQIVIPKMMDNIKPLIQHVKNFSDMEIRDLVSKERHFDKLPGQFQEQLLDEAKKFLSSQPSHDQIQAETKSSVSAQPSQAPVQAVTESSVSAQPSQAPVQAVTESSVATQPSHDQIQAETKSSVSSQPSQAPDQAVTESFVATKPSQTPIQAVTESFVATQPSHDQIQAETKSSVSSQPSHDQIQAETKSFVSDEKSIDNASSTKLSNSKLTTGEKIGRALVTAAGFIGVAITTAALIGGLSFVAPFVIPAAAAITALTMIGGVLLSERIPFLSKLFSRKEPQVTGSEQKNTFDRPAEEKGIDCTTSQVLSKTCYDVSAKLVAKNLQNPVPPTISESEQKQELSEDSPKPWQSGRGM